MEAQLRCSWRPTARLNYPVYGTPSDLRKGECYRPGARSDAAFRCRQRAVLMYCDKFDAYSLGVQGSGRVVLPDNSTN